MNFFKRQKKSLKEEIDTFNKIYKNIWDIHHPFYPLYLYNKLRIPFIEISHGETLLNKKILDVGCGGGFLTESLAMKGAIVTGIDLSENAIEHKTLQIEQTNDVNLIKKYNNIDYEKTDINQYSNKYKKQFDVIVASEIIEHVDNPSEFIHLCSNLLKDKGTLVVTTPNRSFFSRLLIIGIAEYVLRLLPIGVHDYQKFIKPKELENICKQNNLEPIALKGTFFLPKPFNIWIHEPSKLVCYMMSFKKVETFVSKNTIILNTKN